MQDQPFYDVIIVGAGPVGLMLASELRLGGVPSILVLEQAEDPSSPLKQLPFGMRGLSVPTVEAFERRGLLERLRASGIGKPLAGPVDAASNPETRPTRLAGGHFAGVPFFEKRIDRTNWLYRLPDASQAGIAVEMAYLESVLADRVREMGVEVKRGFRVDAVHACDHEVRVIAGEKSYQGRWLVGCDGGRSRVRKACEFEFRGTEPEFTGYSVEVELNDPEMLAAGRQHTAHGMYTYQPPGTIAMVDFDGGRFHGTAPITKDHVQSVLKRISGTGVTVETLKLVTTWTDRAYQTSAYQKGQVLLAGDAAHIHSPLGGQGLNLGLGDAMNLGWKLAATIRGDAPPHLLDSYSEERAPVGLRVLDWSRAQVALMRPSPSSLALRSIMSDLMETRDGATYFAGRIRGVTLQYDLREAHPLVGRSVPDFELIDGTTPSEHLQNGGGLLLDFDRASPLREWTASWKSRITYVGCEAKEQLGLTAVLVRPDGIVAWASDSQPVEPSLERVALKWFGSC